MNSFLKARRVPRLQTPTMTPPRAPAGAFASVAAVAPLPRGSRVPVAIVVINHNGAAFLNECLASVFGQTVKPDEIVFVDDASTDDSREVAAWFKPYGLKMVRRTTCGGMNAARMSGLEKTTAPLLLFVDGDNVLPPDYLATMAAELGDLDFVYPGKVFIGDENALAWSRKWHPGDEWTPEEANRARLWVANQCDTCSLMRREAFMAAGGWRENPAENMSDWDLFLRMSRSGRWARSTARLGYRLHGNNWSLRDAGKDRAAIHGLVRRAAATVTVATMFSGRLPGLTQSWLLAVQTNLQRAGKTAELLVMDDSQSGFPLAWVNRAVFPAVVHRRVRRDGLGTHQRRPDRRATAEFLAGICNEILATATGDVVWFVEDDIVPGATVADTLLFHLLQADGAPRAAVCGAYRSRHPGQDHWLAADYVAGKVEHWNELPATPAPVALTGTGCLMVLRDALEGQRFALEWSHDGRRSPAHDWAFTWALHARGTPVRFVPSATCDHVAE